MLTLLYIETYDDDDGGGCNDDYGDDGVDGGDDDCNNKADDDALQLGTKIAWCSKETFYGLRSYCIWTKAEVRQCVDLTHLNP